MRRILPVILLTTLLFLQSVSAAAAAAALSLSPATGTQTLNTTFNVDVRIDTGTDTIKKVIAYLTFPSQLLSVEDIVTTGSSITTWSERLYSNTNGTVSLSGETGSAGLSGSGKLIATIKFKVKANGSAAVNFTSSSQALKLSDSTDVLSLTTSGNGTYTLGSVTNQPTASPSGSPAPETGSYSPTIAVGLISLFLITLGIWMGRSSFRNS